MHTTYSWVRGRCPVEPNYTDLKKQNPSSRNWLQHPIRMTETRSQVILWSYWKTVQTHMYALGSEGLPMYVMFVLCLKKTPDTEPVPSQLQYDSFWIYNPLTPTGTYHEHLSLPITVGDDVILPCPPCSVYESEEEKNVFTVHLRDFPEFWVRFQLENRNGPNNRLRQTMPRVEHPLFKIPALVNIVGSYMDNAVSIPGTDDIFVSDMPFLSIPDMKMEDICGNFPPIHEVLKELVQQHVNTVVLAFFIEEVAQESFLKYVCQRCHVRLQFSFDETLCKTCLVLTNQRIPLIESGIHLITRDVINDENRCLELYCSRNISLGWDCWTEIHGFNGFSYTRYLTRDVYERVQQEMDKDEVFFQHAREGLLLQPDHTGCLMKVRGERRLCKRHVNATQPGNTRVLMKLFCRTHMNMLKKRL